MFASTSAQLPPVGYPGRLLGLVGQDSRFSFGGSCLHGGFRASRVCKGSTIPQRAYPR